MMPVFRRKTIRGVTYEMDHLEPLRFEVPNSEGILRSVLASFSCHCFTAGLKAHHAPDLIEPPRLPMFGPLRPDIRQLRDVITGITAWRPRMCPSPG